MRAIAEEIDVRYAGRKVHANDEIAFRALDIIERDSALPEGAMDVKVQRGLVTLSGEMSWHFHRLAAGNTVKRLAGAVGLFNLHSIHPSTMVAGIKSQIEGALKRGVEVEADRMIHATMREGASGPAESGTCVERAQRRGESGLVGARATAVENHLTLS